MFVKRKILLNSFKVFDILVMTITFILATWFSFYEQDEILTFRGLLSVRIKIQNIILFALLLIEWHIVFLVYGLYQSKRMSLSYLKESVDVLKVVTINTFLLYFSSSNSNLYLFFASRT